MPTLAPSWVRFALGRKQTVGPILFLEGIFLWRSNGRRGCSPIFRRRLQAPNVARLFEREAYQKSLAARSEGQTIGDMGLHADAARQAIQMNRSLNRERARKAHTTPQRIDHDRARVLRKRRRGRQRGHAHGNFNAHPGATAFALRLCRSGSHERQENAQARTPFKLVCQTQSGTAIRKGSGAVTEVTKKDSSRSCAGGTAR
jgi:hypothetical protein